MSGSEGELEVVSKVGEILGERKSSRRGLEYLVRWKDFGASNDTWEPLKNLVNAAQAIADFHGRTLSQKKTKRKSKSRSRSRSRSRTRRTSSRSPGRKSTSKTTTTTTSSPTKEQTKTETVTRSPGRFEKTTETLTRSILTPSSTQRSIAPSSTQRSTYVSRSSEVKTTTTNREPEPVIPARSAGWLQACCVPMQKMKECCGGLVRSDYPAIVVCATIAVIFLSFVLEKNVDFEKVWTAIVAFFTGVWAWLTQLVSK